jgi:hypothetical protein
MSNNIDLKSIWNMQQASDRPDVSEVLKKAKQLKLRTRNRLIKQNVFLIATVILIACIGISITFLMVTTKIGIMLVIIAIIGYVLVSNGMLASLYKSHPEVDNSSYLQELLTIRQKQDYLQTIVIKIYYVFLTVGLILYMIQFLKMMSILGASLCLLFFLGWLAFSYWYIMPRTIRKQTAALNEIIEKLELLNNQALPQTETNENG